MELKPVIGLEIHVQLKTKSKMFCSCANVLGDAAPNTSICPICMGYPGTLPVPNKTAIEWVQRAGAALNCELAQESKFDRKSYFYPDLPKGYQISQYDKPFCGKGAFSIMVGDTMRTLGITRIHLEEDAAKNIHSTDGTLIDYNRAGTPLMEIVTEPDIASPQEARIFLQELQRVMRTIGVSDADMEKGQMRCDANISLKEEGSATLHPKTEIKNVNSFKFVEKALMHEIERQKKLWEKGTIPTHATRGWDSKKGITKEQRTKEEAADYRYVSDPDIPPFRFTVEELEHRAKTLPELPWEARSRFMKEYGLPAQLAELLIENKILATLFEETASEIAELDQEREDIEMKDEDRIRKIASNIVLHEVRAVIERDSLTIDTIRMTPENIAEVAVHVAKGTIGSNAVKQVIDEMQKTGGDPDAIIQNLGISQESDEGNLATVIDEVLGENAEVVEKVKAGKTASLQFLMGQVMAKTKGKANPGVVMKMLKQACGL